MNVAKFAANCVLMYNKKDIPEPLQSSKMERFAAIVNGFHSLTILANLLILDVCRDRGYVSGIYSVEHTKDYYFHFQTLNKFSLRKF